MYEDNEGQLERLVRHESGRRIPTWDQQGGPIRVGLPPRRALHLADSIKPIQFMLEVKTTINGCGEPFIVSQHQYQLVSSRLR